MPVTVNYQEPVLTASISGDIDHHNAKELRSEIDVSIERHQPHSLVLDMSGVQFMDSSGIGLVMGRYKIMQDCGGEVAVKSCIPPIRRVMRIAGLDKLVKIKD